MAILFLRFLSFLIPSQIRNTFFIPRYVIHTEYTSRASIIILPGPPHQTHGRKSLSLSLSLSHYSPPNKTKHIHIHTHTNNKKDGLGGIEFRGRHAYAPRPQTHYSASPKSEGNKREIEKRAPNNNQKKIFESS